jgi:hypothetical protein
LLFAPLEGFQMAPPGFLQLTKLATQIFGPTDLAFRLPVLLASLATLFLFSRVARMTLVSWEVPFSILVLAVAPMVLTYAVDAKQYTFDLLGSLILSLIMLELRRSHYPRNRVIRACVAGFVIVWFSDASALVMVGLGLAAVMLAIRERDVTARTPLTVIGVAWGSAIGLQQLGAWVRMASGTGEFMRSFWTGAFFPFPPRSINDLLWLPVRIAQIYREGLGLRGVFGVTVALGLGGFVFLWRRNRQDVVLLLGSPIIVALFASALKRYPFDGRLLLFLFPAFIIGLAAGLGSLALMFRRRTIVLIVGALVLLNPARFVFAGEPPPWRRQEMSTLLEEIHRSWKPGDRLYVSAGAAPAFTFYARRYGFGAVKWTRGTWVYDPHDIAHEFVKLRGARRVWVLLAHDKPAGLNARFIQALDSLGQRADSTDFTFTGGAGDDAWVYLYSFSSSVR